MNLEEYYTGRIESINTELKTVKSRLATITTLRLIVATGILGLLIYWFAEDWNWPTGIAMVALASFFGVQVKTHQRVKKLEKRLNTLVTINQNELLALEMNVSGNDDGKEFHDYNLPNAFDLDLFGGRSLYQHISRCASPEGAAQLAEIFKKTLHSKDEIIERQTILKELASKPEWRQNFQAIGKINQPKKRRGRQPRVMVFRKRYLYG